MEQNRTKQKFLRVFDFTFYALNLLHGLQIFTLPYWRKKYTYKENISEGLFDRW